MRQVTRPGWPGTSPHPTSDCCGGCCPTPALPPLPLLLLEEAAAAAVDAVLMVMGKTGAKVEAATSSGAAKDLPQAKLKKSSCKAWE